MSLANDDSLTQHRIKKNKIKLAIILIVPFLVLGSAYFVFYSGIGIPTGTTNRGDLVQPAIPVLDETYLADSGKDYDFVPIWHLYIPVSADCDEQCKSALHTTRQVHLRQGKRAIKIDRVFVATESISPTTLAYLKENHPKSDIVYMQANRWEQLGGELNHQNGDYYLVDPRGWLMMAYREGHQGEDLLKDLKKLLK